MAKSPADSITDLTAQVRVLEERDATRRTEMQEAKALLQRERDERTAADEKHRAEVADLRRELADARQETAVLKKLLEEHIKKTDLADSRRWGLIILALGAIFSLASALIVSLTRK